MLYKNWKVKVLSSDRDTDFFIIVAGGLQVDTSAQYLFIICLHLVLQTSIDLMKENGLTLEKARNRRYPARTVTDTDYADDIALLANTSTETESLLHNQKRVAGGIGLHVNRQNCVHML